MCVCVGGGIIMVCRGDGAVYDYDVQGRRYIIIMCRGDGGRCVIMVCYYSVLQRRRGAI